MKKNVMLIIPVLTICIMAISPPIARTAAVILYENADDVWRDGKQLDLKYCIDNIFKNINGVNYYDGIKTALEEAGKEWARVANVRFRYVSGHDDNCSSYENGMDFSVLLREDERAPSQASYPYASGTARVLKFNPALSHPYTGWTQKAIFVHEMGHLLGLVHEHERFDAPDENPITNETVPECCQVTQEEAGNRYRAITSYDENSIMAYPYTYNYGACADGGSAYNQNLECNVGVGDGYGFNSSLSNLDGYGLRELYGAPASWFVVYGM